VEVHVLGTRAAGVFTCGRTVSHEQILTRESHEIGHAGRLRLRLADEEHAPHPGRTLIGTLIEVDVQDPAMRRVT